MKFCKAELQILQKLCFGEFHNSLGMLGFFCFVFLIREIWTVHSIGSFV